jgi:hypothetical protein
MLFRANSCSEEMGYEHTVFRCWFDNRWIVHYGPLWWLCSGCREFYRDGDRPTITWREVPGEYWGDIQGRWERFRGQRRRPSGSQDAGA